MSGLITFELKLLWVYTVIYEHLPCHLISSEVTSLKYLILFMFEQANLNLILQAKLLLNIIGLVPVWKILMEN